MVRIYTDRTQNKILNRRKSVLFPRNPWLEEKQPRILRMVRIYADRSSARRQKRCLRSADATPELELEAEIEKRHLERREDRNHIQFVVIAQM